MANTCANDTKSCGCQKGYRCSLVAMVGSGGFLFLAVNALLLQADRHMRQGLQWNQDGVIDAVSTGVMAVFALVVFVDSVRSFRKGDLGKVAFFGVLMVWSMAITMVLFYLLIQFLPKFA
jgi:hypothetical protein